MKCKYCGATLEDGTKTCPYCGLALEDDTVTEVSRTVVYEETVVETATEEKPAAPNRPKNNKLLFGAIMAFLTVLVSIGVFFASGLTSVRGGELKVTDYLDFSDSGIVMHIVNTIKDGGSIGSVLTPALCAIVIFATIILFFIELISAIVHFSNACKGKEYSKIGHDAVATFGGYVEAMLLLLAFNAIYAGEELVNLNLYTIVGICVSAALLCVYLIIHAIAGKEKAREKFGMRSAVQLGGAVVGTVVAVLASLGAVYLVSGAGMSYSVYVSVLVEQLMNGIIDTTSIIYILLGFISVVLLVSIGIELLKQSVKNIAIAADGGRVKHSGLASVITLLLFSAVLIAAEYLYAGDMSDLINPVIPIVIMVLSFLGVVLFAIEKALLKKKK